MGETEKEWLALAAYLGEFYAAAERDFHEVGWDDIGLHGIQIKHWRDAYREGIQDTSSGIVAHVPETLRDAFTATARAARLKAAGTPSSPSEKQT